MGLTESTAEGFLFDQIPLPARALLPPTIKTAYETVGLIAEQEPFLNVPSAVDNRGRMITWALDFAMVRLIETGQWPFDYAWKNFAQPTGRYLQIRMSHSVLSISQVRNPNRQPRDVVFRENARLNNQLFFDFDEFEADRSAYGIPHFVMIHGHQTPEFAHLAIPHPESKQEWLYKSRNLMLTPYVVQNDLPDPEPTDFDAILELKEEIDKYRRDNGL